MKPRFIFNIDTSAVCNLRCPSCPQGQTKEKETNGWLHSLLLEKIIIKAKEEVEIVNLELFNWTEPLLHPDLISLIYVCNYHKVKCDLSTNLNRTINFDPLLEMNPFRIRISLSGFTQKIYQQTHAGGDIERVKYNMHLLAEAKKRQKAKTLITVFYHIYQHNFHELPLMRKYAESLGFQFDWCWAALMPVEKVIACVEDRLGLEDQKLVDLLHYDLRAVLNNHLVTTGRCTLLEDKIALDWRGNVKQCCAAFEYQSATIINYLEFSISEIQALRRKTNICERCIKYGIKDYNVGAIKLQSVYARQKVKPENLAILNSLTKANNVRTFFEGISRKLFTVEQSAKFGRLYDKTLGKLMT